MIQRVKTTCCYCGTGCQLWLKICDGKVIDTKPVESPEFNPGAGKLCIKGWNVHEFIHHPDRLTDPLIKRDGVFEKVSWNEALDYIASHLKAIMEEFPNDRRKIGCFSSAKCTNEENYLMQKFARTVLKTNNVDHCARLCHASTVAGLGAAFGSGAMTNSIEEIEDADVIVIIGTNTTEQHPLIGRRILSALKKGAMLIVADPRIIPLSELATENNGLALQLHPGTDVALLNGIMNVIITENLQNTAFIEEHCENYDEFREEILRMPPSLAAAISGVQEDQIITAAHIIAAGKAVSLIYSMGITQHTTGVDNVKTCANLQMLCGNLGRRATGVNPLRGQQNVQGACDMGALPDLYTGYQKVAVEENRIKFANAWGIALEELDEQPGLTVSEMINLAAEGDFKALYIMGENPMMSDPDITHVKAALENVFLIVQDIFLTPTAELASVVLPAVSFAEKDGTFTSTERRVQMVRKAIDPIGNAKADWEIICLLAQSMGSPLFPYSYPKEIMDEINLVTPSYAGITWDRLLQNEQGLQWPCPNLEHPGTPILHKDGNFVRGKGHFFAIPFQAPAEVPDEEYPFILSTGRILWQFHTGTMSRRSPTLNARAPEAYVEVSPQDAERYELQDQEKVQVSTRRGMIEIKVKITPRVSPGLIFIPFHFEEAPANMLTNSAFDPIAKIPELKVCAANIQKISKE